MASEESSIRITIELTRQTPCLCGGIRWWWVVAGKGVGWAHTDGTAVCAGTGA